jgi:hypothetical protein
MFKIPISPITGKPCRYRLVIYFEQKVVFNGKYQDKRLVLHAPYYEQDAQKAFSVLQKTLINTHKGIKTYRFTHTLDQEGKSYAGIATFKSGAIYDTYTDKAIYKLSKYDRVEEANSTTAKKPYPETPNESKIKHLDGAIIVEARQYWRSQGYTSKKYSSMGGGSGLYWYDANNNKIC